MPLSADPLFRSICCDFNARKTVTLTARFYLQCFYEDKICHRFQAGQIASSSIANECKQREKREGEIYELGNFAAFCRSCYSKQI